MKKKSIRYQAKWKINFQTNAHVRKSKIQESVKLKWSKLKLIQPAFVSLIEVDSKRLTKCKVNRQFFECLRAKQAFKKFYGFINDKQFVQILKNALNSKDPKSFLILNLESRLETVLYRSGFFHSIFESRQAIRHGMIQICSNQNKQFVKITKPGFQIQPGDVILHRKTKQINQLNVSNHLFIFDQYICFLNKPVFSCCLFPFKIDLNLILNWIRYV